MPTSYDAFISYSHAADGKLAPALESALEGFAKPWYRLRALHLFRDQTSLSATPGLWPAIEEALQGSRYFLLLASPEAAQSRWVQQEVAWWLEHKSPQTLLIALTDGKIVRHPGATDFDWEATDALPPTLQGVFVENPLWVDFRWAKGQEHLSTKHPEFQNALAALAAPLRNIPKENLIGEDVRQHRRALLLARGASVVLVLLLIAAIGAAFLAVRNQAEAEQQRNEAVVQRNRAEEQATIAHVRQLTAQSNNLADDQLDLSLLLGLEANRISDTPDTRGVIVTALSSSPHLVRYLRGDPDSGRSLAFSPDGNLLAVAREGGVDIWSIAEGEHVTRALTGHAGKVLSVAFSPAEPNLLASAGDDATIRLWDIASRRPSGEPLVGHSDMVNSIAFSPDGAKLVSGSEDGTVIVWDIAERRQIGEALTADDAVTSVAVSPDGKTFAVGGGLDTIVLWDTETRRQIRVLTTGEFVAAWSLAFSPRDATMLASGGYDGTVRLWDVPTGEERGLPLLGHRGVVSSLAFSPDGGTLASGSFDGTLRLWDVQTRQAIDEPLTGHGRIVEGVAFRPGGGSPALASSSEDGRVILWDVEVGHRLGLSGPNQAMMGISPPVQDLAFGPDETTLASTALGVNLWDVKTRQPIGAVGVSFEDIPTRLAFNPQDRRMLAFGSTGGTVALWDATTSTRLVSPVAAHTKGVQDVAFNSDGTLMVSASEDGTVQLWDGIKMAPVGPPISGYADEVMSVAFSPIDRNLLAFGGTEGTLVLWDIEAERPRGEPLVGHEERVQSVAFSPNGRLLVSGSADGTVRRWDPATGEAQGQFPIAESSNVLIVAFSPDGELLAAGDAGGSIHLWDVATRQPLGSPLTGHANSLLSLAFSPDGRTLASGGLDGQIILWNVDFDSWRAMACGLANRNLTLEEWSQYIGDPGNPTLAYHAICPELPLPVEPGVATPVGEVAGGAVSATPPSPVVNTAVPSGSSPALLAPTALPVASPPPTATPRDTARVAATIISLKDRTPQTLPTPSVTIWSQET
jgi:WD40 repeat protein